MMCRTRRHGACTAAWSRSTACSTWTTSPLRPASGFPPAPTRRSPGTSWRRCAACPRWATRWRPGDAASRWPGWTDGGWRACASCRGGRRRPPRRRPATRPRPRGRPSATPPARALTGSPAPCRGGPTVLRRAEAPAAEPPVTPERIGPCTCPKRPVPQRPPMPARRSPRASCPASSPPPTRSISATIWAPSGSGSRCRTRTTPSTAWSTCTPSRSSTTPRPCAAAPRSPWRSSWRWASTQTAPPCSCRVTPLSPPSRRGRWAACPGAGMRGGRRGATTSRVSERAELAWVLGCLTGFGEAGRMTKFKDKSSKQGTSGTTVGLFTYPILQAADILLYTPEPGEGERVLRVPVGEDQRQHLELTRTLAQRFNHRFGETFVLPEAHIPSGAAKITDLQEPDAKMSKSASSPQGIIDVLEEPGPMRKKIMRAVTDTGTEVVYDEEKKAGVTNLLRIYSALEGTPIPDLERRYEGSGYGQFKKD